MAELDWLGGGYEGELSSELGEIAYQGAEEMHDHMAHDTGWLKASVFQETGFLFAEFGTKGTTYAGFNDGAIPITSRPYTTTPFFLPTVEWLENNIDIIVLDVITAKRGG